MKPADSCHPYGHYKAEYFSAIFAGLFIISAGIVIFYDSFKAYFNPKPFDITLEGLVVNIIASVLNGIWAWVLIHYGKRYRSPAIMGDGKHLVVDVMTSIGVVAGLVLVRLTGYTKLDSILAAIIAINILHSGCGLVREAVEGLMDAAPSLEEIGQMNAIIAKNSLTASGFHNLKVRHAGRAIFIEFHLVVPGQMSVRNSHDICDRIELALRAAFGHSIVTIHVEPAEGSS